jgi:tetratricopeptide (TPR) repeat protein
MRLLVMIDPGQVAIGIAAFQEYIEVEENPELKKKAELAAAHMLLQASATDSAIDWFQRMLVSDPKDLEARLGYGLALYQSGDRKRFAEAARYLRGVLDEAPEGDSLRQVAAETLEKLKANP